MEGGVGIPPGGAGETGSMKGIGGVLMLGMACRGDTGMVEEAVGEWVAGELVKVDVAGDVAMADIAAILPVPGMVTAAGVGLY